MKKKGVTLESLYIHINKVEKEVSNLRDRVDFLQYGVLGSVETKEEVIECSESDLPLKDKRVRVEYQYIPKTLNDYTPEEISKISRSGKAEEYFNIGDSLTIYFDDQPHTATIITFNHYTDSKGDTCGITFQLDGLGNKKMNWPNTNKGGYVCSDLRKDLEDIFEDTTITDGKNYSWKNYIRKTNIDCYIPGYGVLPVDDYFFLPSVTEILGSPVLRKDKYGDYYTSSVSLAIEGVEIPCLHKHTCRGNYYWTRSAYLSNSTGFWAVTSSGNLNHNYANNSYGVLPCFSI